MAGADVHAIVHVTVTAATALELARLRAAWPAGPYHPALELEYLASGVGPVATAVAVSERLAAAPRPDLLLDVGLAGALDRSLALGEVVHVVREEFGDLGVEERDGGFTSAVDLGLVDADAPPFRGGRLHSPREPAFARTVTGVTCSTVHGEAASIARLRARTDAQVESMEGAAAMWVAQRRGVAFVQLRAISNYVEPRDRAAWRIDLALDNLAEAVSSLLSGLPGVAAARSARRRSGR